jgi:hypothetical protein
MRTRRSWLDISADVSQSDRQRAHADTYCSSYGDARESPPFAICQLGSRGATAGWLDHA